MGLYPSRIKQQMSSSDSCAVIPVLTIRSGVGRSSQLYFHLSYINGCAYRRHLIPRDKRWGGDPILIPHGNAVYDGLHLPAKEFMVVSPELLSWSGAILNWYKYTGEDPGSGMQQRVGVRGSGGI